MSKPPERSAVMDSANACDTGVTCLNSIQIVLFELKMAKKWIQKLLMELSSISMQIRNKVLGQSPIDKQNSE